MELFTFKGPENNFIEMTAPSLSQAQKMVKRIRPGEVFRLESREPANAAIRLPSMVKNPLFQLPSIPKPKRRRAYRRNDQCPCGSGKKVKHCCASPRPRKGAMKKKVEVKGDTGKAD